MAVYKCKMCGGLLEISEGTTVCECEYCGTKQTLPKINDDQKINMFNRASHFRQQCDFDKAAEIYEKIAESGKDAELFWSIVLCRYGIEYVDDPVTKKKIPTCHRTQYKSILDDPDYLTALDLADTIQRKIYEHEAVVINNIQKGILEISNKEEPFDVFICYKETDENGRRTADSVLAQDLYYGLTQEGFKVFFSRITLESKLGTEYEPYIFAALNSAKVMVVVGTKPEYFNAVWVRNEWSRYLQIMQKDKNRILIPAYRDMDPYDLPNELSLFQSQDMSKIGFLQDLIRGIKKITNHDNDSLVVKQNNLNESNVISQSENGLNSDKKKSGFIYSIIGLGIVLCLGTGIIFGSLVARNKGNVSDISSQSSISEELTSLVSESEEMIITDEVQITNAEMDNYEFIDNKWAAFLVNSYNPAYINAEDGYKILDVLSRDSIIGSIALNSRNAVAPAETMAYGISLITAGGPVSGDSLAYGKLSEIPNSFLDAMVADMKGALGKNFGDHDCSAEMGYNTFYQDSYDVNNGTLKVNQENGYWAHTPGIYSEHCAGIAVDFNISYNNREYLKSSGLENRNGTTDANKEFTWLADNAHKYGFIWRYKIDGNTNSALGNRTGNIYEGWHWRFVGVYNATKFWEKCAADTDDDGVLDKGYMKNDNYIWEDYYTEYIANNPSYPHSELEAFTDFYKQEDAVTYEEYIFR